MQGTWVFSPINYIYTTKTHGIGGIQAEMIYTSHVFIKHFILLLELF